MLILFVNFVKLDHIMRISVISIIVFISLLAYGQSGSNSMILTENDSLSLRYKLVNDSIFTNIGSNMPLSESADTLVDAEKPEKKRGNIIDRIIDYFDDTNKPHKEKDFDVSFIGGPYYSSDTKFGIGLVAAGLYRCDKADTLLPQSNVSLYLKATTSLFFQLGVNGTNIFRGDHRLNYDVNIASVRSKFWGIGYDENIDDANESNYYYIASQAIADFQWRIADKIYLGPAVRFDYINGRKFAKPWLWHDEEHRTFNLGVGFTFTIDSRDCMTAPAKGFYLRFDQRFNPRFLMNKYAFSLSELTIANYVQGWRGCVIAADFHARLTYGNTPWSLLSTLGGSHTMRGYYEGRYRDKCAMDICVELRQHIWRRNGVVAWIGAGTVFDKFESLRWRKVLPNYGVGYRWEFKQRVNVRFDVGFGRHCKGFIFSINEAF